MYCYWYPSIANCNGEGQGHCEDEVGSSEAIETYMVDCFVVTPHNSRKIVNSTIHKGIISFIFIHGIIFYICNMHN